MTEKEKAKELVEEFKPFTDVWDGHISGWNEQDQQTRAEQCALIASDEIIKELERAAGKDYEVGHIVDYWLTVKQEVSKL